MTRKDIERKAFDYHQAGFHCTESVAKAIIDTYGNGDDDAVSRAATAFGGGIGRTHEDVCGALSGGVLAIGWLFGRSKPGSDWKDAYEPAAELRKRFLLEYGSTNCGAILELFGEQENMTKCKRLSGRVAGMLSEILEAKAGNRRAEEKNR